MVYQLYSTQIKVVYFEFAGFRGQKYTAYECSMEMVRVTKYLPSKNQSERSVLSQNYLAI